MEETEGTSHLDARIPSRIHRQMSLNPPVAQASNIHRQHSLNRGQQPMTGVIGHNVNQSFNAQNQISGLNGSYGLAAVETNDEDSDSTVVEVERKQFH